MYIGPQQRLESTVFSNFISGFDPAPQPLHVTLAPANAFRAYVLGSVQDIGEYLIQYANPNAPLSGASIRLDIPTNGMSGQWIDPATGNILKAFNVPSGAQILQIPPFMFDVALRIRAGGVWRHDLLLRHLDPSRKVGTVSEKPTYQAGSRVILTNELGVSRAKGNSPRTSCVISPHQEGMAEIEKGVVIFPGNRTALSSRRYV